MLLGVQSYVLIVDYVHIVVKVCLLRLISDYTMTLVLHSGLHLILFEDKVL